MSGDDVDADGEPWLGELATEEADPAERTGPPVWMTAAMGVVAVAYLAVAGHGVLTVIGDLLGWAGDNAFRFPGSAPSDGRAELRGDVLALTVRAVCIAAVGVVLGLWWRRRLAVAVFGGAAVVALVVGLTTYVLAAENQVERPEWEDRPRVCQEHSGGDTRCPGG